MIKNIAEKSSWGPERLFSVKNKTTTKKHLSHTQARERKVISPALTEMSSGHGGLSVIPAIAVPRTSKRAR